MSKTFSAIVTQEDGGFVALNPDTHVASQGNTLDEALGLYFEETSEKSTNTPLATYLTTITI